ncbi:hypothetical protein [Vibrio harveyi]|uniref:hypothetical protein n=1 Tax=Vibrio harveyi TaxID=669 RepID=UPI0003F4CDDD|nr:hypothetical protein [Vibrio harveyi]
MALKPVRLPVGRGLIAALVELYPDATSATDALTEHLKKTLPNLTTNKEASVAQGAKHDIQNQID